MNHRDQKQPQEYEQTDRRWIVNKGITIAHRPFLLWLVGSRVSEMVVKPDDICTVLHALAQKLLCNVMYCNSHSGFYEIVEDYIMLRILLFEANNRFC